MQTCSIKWNYSNNYVGFFFTKVAPVQNITDIVLLDFWLILLSWMLISPALPFIFSLRISLCFIRCSNVFIYFLVEKGVINKVRTQFMGKWGVIQNAYNCLKREGVSNLMCMYALTLSLFVFLIWTRNSWIWTRNSWIWTHNLWI